MAAHIPGSVLRPIVPILVSAEGRTMETYALLDTGANCDAIVPFIVKKLDIRVKTEPRNLVSFGSRKVTLTPCDLVDFEVMSLDSKVGVSVRNALVNEILTTSRDRPPSNEDVEGLENMEGVVTFHELESDLIGVILSVKHAKTWSGGEVIEGKPNEVMA